MSKVKVKFMNGNNQPPTKITQLQKGPIVYDNLYQIHNAPQYRPIALTANNQSHQIQINSNPEQRNLIESNVQPFINTYKSQQTLGRIKPTESVYVNEKVPLIPQSVVAINTRFNQPQPKREEKHLLVKEVIHQKDSEQQRSQIRHMIEQEASRQYVRQTNQAEIKKLIPKKEVLVNNIPTQTKKTINVKQIQQINESQFAVNPALDPFSKNIITSLPHTTKAIVQNKPFNPNQIVIKAPSFRQVSNTPGHANLKGTKREYIKGEGQKKYLYNGIQQKQENDFMGCFACCKPKSKAFSVGKRQNL